MSNDTIINFINSLAKKSSDVIADLKNNLLNSNLMYIDATTTRCSNRNSSVRTSSTSKYTLLEATLGKSKKCI